MTREQLAVLMMNALQLSDVEFNSAGEYVFVDESQFSTWPYDSIYLAKANGIVEGVGEDRFDPQGTATAEAAMMITYSMLKNNDNSMRLEKEDNLMQSTIGIGSFNVIGKKVDETQVNIAVPNRWAVEQQYQFAEDMLYMVDYYNQVFGKSIGDDYLIIYSNETHSGDSVWA